MAYKSTHTGQQIDAGVSAALNPDTTPTAGSDALITSGGTKSALMHDLANIVATGTTNTTGAVIESGTYFYLNGVLVRAKSNIAVNATFTSGTNYEAVTAGGLNELKAAIDKLVPISIPISLTSADTTKTVDVSSYIPSGKSLRGIAAPTLGAYPLPYISGGTIKTWVAETPANGLIYISNSVQWGTYTFRGLLYIE